MVRRIFFISAAIACTSVGLIGCKDPAGVEEPVVSDKPVVPSGVDTIFTEGFGGDLSKWSTNYMINVGDFYPQMQITTNAANSGTHAATTDSNRTALLYKFNGNDKISSGTAGVEFSIMAKEKGQINFTLEIGQNAGSSGGLCKRFGIGFDVNDSIKATTYDTYVGQTDKMVGPIQLGHWYKCKVEVNFGAKTISYYIDGAKIDLQTAWPDREMYGIDRLLVFRGLTAGSDNQFTCSEGKKQYYIDDIVLYSK